MYFFHSTLLFVPGLKKERGKGGRRESGETHVRKMQRTDRDAERDGGGGGGGGGGDGE